MLREPVFGAAVFAKYSARVVALCFSSNGSLHAPYAAPPFRTSHEVMKVKPLETDDIRAVIDDSLVRAHRERALTPDRLVLRGATQDVARYCRERSDPVRGCASR